MKKGYLIKKLGGIPKNWKENLLPEVSWFQEGPGLRKWQFREEGIKVINITNMVDGVLDLSRTNRHISKEEFQTSYTHFECQENDIVVASSGNSYCKHAIVRKKDLPLVMNTSVIRFKPLSVIVYDYLNQFLKSSFFKEQIDFMITGGAQPNFGPVHLNKVVLALPPLPEQQKIADILSTVDAKIEVIDQQITETQDLKKGLMQRLLTKGIGHTEFKDSALGEIPVGWELKELGSLLKAIKGGGTPSKDITEYWKPEIPWVTVKDFKKLILDDSIDYISKIGLENSAANLIPAWTLIISTRMAVGKAIFVTKDVSINQDLKALFPKENLNKFFLFHWFFANSENILKLASGSTVKGIRLEVLKGLKLVLPPIEEQQKIAKILTSVDDKLEVLSEKKTTYQELKKGLMQQLLTGKVRVRV